MKQQSHLLRYRPVFVGNGYQVEDTADGKRFPHIHRYWTSAHYDALRRERGNARPFQPNLKLIQAKYKTA